MALKSVNSFTPHTAFEWTGHFFQGRVSHQACMPEGDFSASWWSRLTWNKSLCCLIYWKKSSELFTLIWLVIITWAICGLSRCSHVWLFVTPWTVARWALLSMGFSRPRTLEWVTMPSSRGAPIPGMELASLRSPELGGGCFFCLFFGVFFLPLAPPGKSNGKESTYKAGDAGLIPGSVRSPGEVFLPGKFHGQRKLGGYPGVSELDLTEQLTLELFAHTIKFLLSFWRQPSWSEGYPWDE